MSKPASAAPDPFVVIRPAHAKDADGLSTVSADAWRGAYRGIIPHLDLERFLRPRDAAYWAHVIASPTPPFVLTGGGDIGGYATLGRARNATAAYGEIQELYLAPVFQGIGLGERLFAAARAALAEKGYRSLIVWSLTSNEAACTFYRHRGGKLGPQATQRFGTSRLVKQAFLWDD